MPQLRAQITPDQIARFGHIATAIREALDAKGWTVAQLNEAAGKKPSATQPYQYMNCRAAPTPVWRAILHKHLGIPMKELREKPLLQTEGAVQVAEAAHRALPPPARLVGDVLQFAVNSAGGARVRLDVTLPVKEAMPLIRLLLDQGFILSGDDAP